MNIKLKENERWVHITLSPDNMKEVSSLFRLIKNAKREPVEMFMSFSEYSETGEPCLSMTFYTKKEKITSINNRP